MPRIGRTRTRNFDSSNGSIVSTFSGTTVQTVTGSAVQAQRWSCIDSSGRPFVDSDLTIDKYNWREPLKLNGVAVQGSYRDTYSNMTPNIWAIRGQQPPIPAPNWEILAASAMANASPNKPEVDIPVFFKELKELPSLIRSLGNLLRRHPNWRTAQETYLGWEFGWRPLLDDLYTMVTFQQAIASRVAYLERLQRGPTSVQRSLGSSGVKSRSATQLVAGGTKSTVYGYTELQGKWDYWYSMQLALVTDLSSVKDLRNAAIRAVFGLEISPATLWNMVPWTWLVGWFSNFGSLAELTRGIVEYRQSSMCLMARGTFDYNHVITSKSHSTILVSGNPSASRVMKLREARVPYAAPALYMPWLSTRQVGILGSLATLRLLGSRR